MTMTKKRASGLRANGKSVQAEPFFDVDVFTKKWGLDFNVLYRTIYDVCHGLGNNVADIFNIMLNNSGKDMYYSQVRRTYEQVTLGRFQDYAKRERMPWMISKRAKIILVRVEFEGVLLKVPNDWVPSFPIASGIPNKVCVCVCVSV